MRENDATIDGIDYQVPTKDELIRISKKIRKSLGLSDDRDLISNNYIDNYPDADSSLSN